MSQTQVRNSTLIGGTPIYELRVSVDTRVSHLPSHSLMHLFCLFIGFVGIIEAEIEMVQVLFRHGDRAPSNTYPLDPHKVEIWPRGLSQLTDLGYSQAQELGEYLHYRYMKQYKLLGKKYDRKKVIVRSSDKDRCIETAMGVLSTLFPGQIVPIHTYSSHKEDLLLKPNSVRCDRADRLVSADKKLLYDERNSEYKELFAYVSQHTGMHISMSNIKDIYNAIYRENANGLPQPSWVFKSLYPGMNSTVFDNIVELKRQDRMETFNSPEKSRLRTGFLLGQLSLAIEERIRGITQRNIALYSTHDATLTSLMYNLGVSNDILPPYASALLFEIHNIHDSYFVKILFRNSTSAEPISLQIPGCLNVLCPLSVFLQYTALRSFHSRLDFENACENYIHERSTAICATMSRTLSNLQPTMTAFYVLVAAQVYMAVYLYFSMLGKEYIH